MRRTFTYCMLITWFLLALSCKTNYVTTLVNTQNIAVSDTLNELDSQLVQIYIPYKKLLEKDMDRVISFSDEEMVKDKPESNLTNFLADLLLDFALAEAQENGLNVHPQVSFFNYGGIRTPLPKGNITVGKIFELMPFENELVFVQLSGEQVQEFFDVVAEKGGDSVGGARFVISDQKAKNVVVEGKKLEPAQKYWVATNDYIAYGGDGLDVFTKNSGLITTGKKIRDIIIAELETKQKNGETLKIELDGRISHE